MLQVQLVEVVQEPVGSLLKIIFTKQINSIKMGGSIMKYIVSAIVFISMAIVLVFSPSQLFSRHDPIMIRLFNSKPVYKKFLRYVGYILFIAGICCAFAGVYRIIT